MKIQTEAGYGSHYESNQNESVTNNTSLVQQHTRDEMSIFQAFNHQNLKIKIAGHVDNDRIKPYFVVEGFKPPEDKEITNISVCPQVLCHENDILGRDIPSAFLITMADKTVYRYDFKNENKEFVTPFSPLEMTDFFYDRKKNNLFIYAEAVKDCVG